MANNRLYLVNKRLGLAVRLATYRVGGEGWEVVPGTDGRLADAFALEEHPGWEGSDWEVQHEGTMSPGLRELGTV